MAHICYLPKGSCKNCKYFHKDEDGRVCCFAEKDILVLEPKQGPYVVTVSRDGVELGSMELDPGEVCWAGDEFGSAIQALAFQLQH